MVINVGVWLVLLILLCKIGVGEGCLFLIGRLFFVVRGGLGLFF